MRKMFLSVFTVVTLVGSSYALTDLQACYSQFHAGNYKIAVQYGQKAVRENPTNPAAYFCLGKAYTKLGQVDEAIDNFQKAAQYDSNDYDLTLIYNWLGNVYRQKGDYSKALLYASRSLRLAHQYNDVKLERNNLNNIGLIFRDKGDTPRALKYYEKALSLSNGQSETGVIYNNIALAYADMHNYQKAVEYFKKAIDTAEEHGYFLNSGEYMLNLGDTYRQMKDFKDAKEYLERGLERVKAVGNVRWEAIGNWLIGLYYNDIGNKVLAKDYLTKAYTMFMSIGDGPHASAVMRVIAAIK